MHIYLELSMPGPVPESEDVTMKLLIYFQRKKNIQVNKCGYGDPTMSRFQETF